MQIPFSPPRIDDKIVAEVSEALRSGWITTGPRTKKFEQKIAEYVDVPRVVCLNSDLPDWNWHCAGMVFRKEMRLSFLLIPIVLPLMWLYIVVLSLLWWMFGTILILTLIKLRRYY